MQKAHEQLTLHVINHLQNKSKVVTTFCKLHLFQIFYFGAERPWHWTFMHGDVGSRLKLVDWIFQIEALSCKFIIVKLSGKIIKHLEYEILIKINICLFKKIF